MKTRTEQRLGAHGVHAGQQFLLECLWQEDGLTPGELARRIRVETATITREAQRMERRGLVRRRPDPDDARLVRVFLTDKGSVLRSVIPEVMHELAEEALRGIDPANRAHLADLLDRIGRNLRDKAP